VRYLRLTLIFASLFVTLAACHGPQALSVAASIALGDVPTPAGFSLSTQHAKPLFIVAGSGYRSGEANFWGPGSTDSITIYMTQALPDFGWQFTNDVWVKGPSRLSFSVTPVIKSSYNDSERAALFIKLWSAR